MSSPIITVENLSKRYFVGHEASKERYHALRDTVVHYARNIARRTIDTIRGRPLVQGDEVEEFWALKDISFEVEQGETLGIIGHNGAGKSTLLKILSRITEPSQGHAILRGRVASLLEVGTGFHPELTGRENIFLNGAILGMTRAEIRKKFDEIVDFAGVEMFLDTPVKRYSSGMYVRLAFAVAAHLDPEILVVDEVLAVGDGEFQKKCLGKMQDVSSKDGRTVLFVSHNMAAIQKLTKRSLLLFNGEVKALGETNQVISEYTKLISSNNESLKPKPGLRSEFVSVSCAFNNQHVNLLAGDKILIDVEINTDGGEAMCLEGYLLDEKGDLIGFFSPEYFGGVSLKSGITNHHISLRVDVPEGLAEGQYYITLVLAERMVRVDCTYERAVSFVVSNCYLNNGYWSMKQEHNKGNLAIHSQLTYKN